MQLTRRIRLSALLSVFAISSLASTARATVLINPPAPYPQHNMGDTSYSIFLGGSSSGSPYNSAFYNGTDGYRFINTAITAVEDNLVWLDVSSSQKFTLTANQHVVVTLSASSTAGSEIPLYGAGIVSTNIAPPLCGANGVVSCQGSRTGASNLSAYYQPNTVLRLSFYIPSLCSAQGASTGTLCATSSPNYANLSGKTLTQPIIVTFSVVSDNLAIGAVGGANVDTLTFTLGMSDIAPSVSCPVSGSIADYYFPGDSQVYVNPNNYVRTTGQGNSVQDVGTDLKSLLFLGNRSGTNPLVANSVPSNEVIAYALEGSGNQAITGFVNSTNGSDNRYKAELYAQNVIGVFSPSSCVVPSPYVTAQTIQGVLTESKCFIATAAYQDGRAAPVMMLRQFRDRILAKTDFGRKFIKAYYHWSPALAEWAWDKPIVRSFALRALAPVEMVAWGLLHISNAEEPSVQPYIDRLKKNLGSEGTEPQGNESYIEQELKKLQPAPTPDDKSYIDRLKGRIPEEASSEGYTDQERSKVPEEKVTESPIDAVKAGRPNIQMQDRPTINSAIGFKLGVSPGISVTNTKGTVSYNALYGTNWQPDFLLHWEHQFFHSEYLGSFGAGVDTGVTYAGANGLLSFAFNGSNVSQTKFSFLQIPMIFNAYYRFNLLRILRPYLGAGAGSMFYTEVRKDNAGDKRGYSFVYTGSAGISLALDFLDSKTALDGYLSRGIQHTYLTAEYLYLTSFNKTGVYFERSGIYSGFLFEI